MIPFLGRGKGLTEAIRAIIQSRLSRLISSGQLMGRGSPALPSQAKSIAVGRCLQHLRRYTQVSNTYWQNLTLLPLCLCSILTVLLLRGGRLRLVTIYLSSAISPSPHLMFDCQTSLR